MDANKLLEQLKIAEELLSDIFRDFTRMPGTYLLEEDYEKLDEIRKTIKENDDEA